MHSMASRDSTAQHAAQMHLPSYEVQTAGPASTDTKKSCHTRCKGYMGYVALGKAKVRSVGVNKLSAASRFAHCKGPTTSATKGTASQRVKAASIGTYAAAVTRAAQEPARQTGAQTETVPPAQHPRHSKATSETRVPASNVEATPHTQRAQRDQL